MRAIAHELDLLFKIYMNEKNKQHTKLLEKTKVEIEELSREYFRLRGSGGLVVGVANAATYEANSVHSICSLVCDIDPRD